MKQSKEVRERLHRGVLNAGPRLGPNDGHTHLWIWLSLLFASILLILLIQVVNDLTHRLERAERHIHVLEQERN